MKKMTGIIVIIFILVLLLSTSFAYAQQLNYYQDLSENSLKEECAFWGLPKTQIHCDQKDSLKNQAENETKDTLQFWGFTKNFNY